MQNNNPSMQELMRMAQSPAGQQLLQMLQQKGGKELQDAMAKAAAGDFEQAKQAVSSLLQNQDAQKLLDQLGR